LTLHAPLAGTTICTSSDRLGCRIVLAGQPFNDGHPADNHPSSEHDAGVDEVSHDIYIAMKVLCRLM
jgi:hypothetical protein